MGAHFHLIGFSGKLLYKTAYAQRGSDQPSTASSGTSSATGLSDELSIATQYGSLMRAFENYDYDTFYRISGRDKMFGRRAKMTDLGTDRRRARWVDANERHAPLDQGGPNKHDPWSSIRTASVGSERICGKSSQCNAPRVTADDPT